MAMVFVFLALLAVSSAINGTQARRHSLRSLPALQHEEVHDKFGQFALRYVTAEGTIVSERGRLVPNTEGTGYVMVVDGEVSYIGDDGKTYFTKYTAGLDGYKVDNAHSPFTPKGANE